MYKKLMTVIPVILFLIFGGLMYFDAIRSTENIVYDNLLQTERAPDRNILIIGIDERSVNEIGTWPWPRYYMADTINKLLDLGVAVIGVDVLYDSYGSDPEYDEKLVETASRSDRVIFGAMGVFGESEQEVLRATEYVVPFEELNNATKTAFLNVIPDSSDGIIRKAIKSFKYGDSEVTAFPVEIYNTYCDSMGIEKVSIPTNKFNQYNIDYVAKAGSFSQLSFIGVLNGEYPEDIFQNAIALIGPYAQGIGMDNYYTPVDQHEKTYGIEIHANTIQNLLEDNFKQDVHWYWNLAGLTFFCIVSIYLYRKLKPVYAAISFAVMLAVQLGVAKLLYAQFDVVIVSIYTLLFLTFAYVFQLILSLLSAQHERTHIRNLFGRFVSPEVVQEIVSGNVSVELGGVLRDVTLLFVDIRGFTAFSEANPPEKVVEMVNRYLSLTSKSIQKNGGTIDKYIGDATMAVFNAPTDLKDHALCGVKAAWDMKIGAEELREQILRDFGVDLQFGIGINTGQAVVGNMGSDFRMDYTVIGDTVNTAARLESNAKKGQIIISDAVYQCVQEYIEVNDLGLLMVKNKKDGIHVYEVINVN